MPHQKVVNWTASSQTKTIMVVDDEEDLLAVTKKMLEINGYSVHAFDNPIKGLEHV